MNAAVESGPIAKSSSPLADDDAPPPPPKTPARFVLRETLGRGGMGVVYRAYDSDLGLDVALKALSDLSTEGRTWLKAEFRSLAGIVHPNLVQLHELVVDDERCFFTMELVRGLDLIAYFAGHSAQHTPAATTESWLRIVRESGRQLAHALASLHRAGKLHRDVKPSNVLVTESGRVVLLDFGLVEPIATGFDPTQGKRLIAGTLPYMSPEQCWGQRLTAASDWYSFGVTLFEAITGRLPIDGEPASVFAAKRAQPGAHPSRFVEGVPDELDALVARLLDPDPANRPGEQEILATLGGGSVQGIVSLPPSTSERRTAPFRGRDQELQLLESAWQTAAAGKAVVVNVSGPSGIGKSELIRRFLETQGVRSGGLVLSGRCHPQESLPFNALDGVIDDLANSLARLDLAEVEAIRPPDLDALLRVFPTLSRVPSFVPLELAPHRDRATPELRRQAFAALKVLFSKLSKIRVPVLWLDDLQWADVDSVALLRELLRGPERSALLAILSQRADATSGTPVVQLGPIEDSSDISVQPLQLSPLSDEDGLALIRELLPATATRAESRLRALHQEAGGSPFLLCELGRYFRGLDQSDDASALHVEAMLEHRTAQLPDEARRLLELVSVAGEPVEQRVVLRAAGLEPSQLPLIRTLEQLSFVSTAAGAERLAEIYHHRLRDHLLEGMPVERRQSHHLALAAALLFANRPSLQSVVEHAERGGDTAAVRRYILPAARQAADAFAFARAAALYRRAIELQISDIDETELYTQLGSALANAGHGRESGEAYENAALVLLSQTAPNSQRLHYLRRRAAEQFLQSGHDQQAVKALRDVLAAQGVPFPSARSQALSWALGLRMKSLFKNLEAPTRSEREVPRELTERFDAIWAVTMRLTMVNHTRTSYFSARCLMAALEAREPSRIVLGLSLEAPNVAMVPAAFFQRRADRMLSIAGKLAERTGSAYDRAIALSGRGATEWLRGRWLPSLELMDEASDLIRQSSQGVSWEHALFGMWAMAALAHLGRFKQLAARAHGVLRDAELRDDRYLARNCYLGQSTLAWLAEDRPEWAEDCANKAIGWSPEEYTTQHYHHYLSGAQTLLYVGEGTRAHERTVKEWPLLKQNLFLGAPAVRDELLHLRGRTALAAALSAGGKAQALWGQVRKDAKALASHGLACSRGWAELLLGAVNLQAGDRSGAQRSLETAREHFRQSDMAAYAQAAAYRLGDLVGGASGDSLRQESLRFFEQQAVKDPQRFLAMLAPGYPA